MDICNTTTPHRHFHHHGSNGSVSVALCLKFQSNLHCNIAEHTKHCLGLLIQEFICTVVIEKRETEYEKWVNCLSQTERKNLVRREIADIEPDIIFLVFCCSSCTCLPTSSSLHSFAVGVRLLHRAHPKIFCPSSPGLQLFVFSCFQSRVPPNNFSVWGFFLPIRICHGFATETFLFLTKASAAILT